VCCVGHPLCNTCSSYALLVVVCRVGFVICIVHLCSRRAVFVTYATAQCLVSCAKAHVLTCFERRFSKMLVLCYVCVCAASGGARRQWAAGLFSVYRFILALSINRHIDIACMCESCAVLRLYV
jgi:hypothetical protein